VNQPPRFNGARHRGERHTALGQPCCDALLLPRTPHGLSGFVLCDGAGGDHRVARAAASGVRAGWQALLGLRRDLLCHRRLQSDLLQLQRRFRSRFLQACARGASADHTLLACLWDRRQLLLVQVGDSTALVRCQGRWCAPLPPAKGSYANETTFLRPSTAPAAIRIWQAPAASVEAVIGFSDGLEAAFLSPQGVNGELADLVLHQHRQRCGSRRYCAWLAESLRDPALAALSDDDRTLVIAGR
jgi:Protein phosphatase 2C